MCVLSSGFKFILQRGNVNSGAPSTSAESPHCCRDCIHTNTRLKRSTPTAAVDDGFRSCVFPPTFPLTRTNSPFYSALHLTGSWGSPYGYALLYEFHNTHTHKLTYTDVHVQNTHPHIISRFLLLRGNLALRPICSTAQNCFTECVSVFICWNTFQLFSM